ncbi:MAG: PLP-dependent aminotransferase family protein [Lachnospiraceae bacterium]|jgi:Transcriptional regulators containing a DNA-binding HTH domain and an aminotransferase domain (MocR family) and their eukaryotic orthologs|nr:PLP-dependent aminotransferase family protein [Lachnospiraceae bacterium]
MKLDLNSAQTTRYLQVYDYYKELITAGRLAGGTKMPSIRRCAQQLGLSRTTIETAYLCLAADGYIISRPQSGYYVTGRAVRKASDTIAESPHDTSKNKILYNFTSNNVDADSFDFSLWRRYIKSTLRQDGRMLTYGEPQGEYELREVICKYVLNKRNAVCRPENIVIGAGSQALMNILCPLIKKRKNVCFHDSRFAQGIVIFEDYGFSLVKNKEEADILYMTPSHMTSLGDVMNVEKRLSMLKECAENNRLIIEDDYDNEFRYFSKPIPCLQGLAGGENVVYLSTFSKLLLPSIRLSFMILPDALLPFYEKKKALYNQTASKSEQLALCQFLRDGHLESQIRKLKRLYTNKAKALSSELERAFGRCASTYMGESVFLVHLKINCKMSGTQLRDKAQSRGLSVFAFGGKEEEGCAHIALSCCEVPITDFPDAAALLRELVTQEG